MSESEQSSPPPASVEVLPVGCDFTDWFASCSRKTKTMHGECWIWTGELDRYGFGVVSPFLRRTAHLVAWAIEHGGARGSDRKKIRHTCAEPACVNTEHLTDASVLAGMGTGYPNMANTRILRRAYGRAQIVRDQIANGLDISDMYVSTVLDGISYGCELTARMKARG